MSISLSAQIPTTLNVRMGSSEMKGLTGIELQVSNFSISGGWRPTYMPVGHVIHSFDAAVTIYSKQQYASSWYFSVGRASKGIVYLTEFNPIQGIYDYKVEPAIITMLGYRCNLNTIYSELSNRLSIDTGLGYSAGKHGDMFIFEIILNYVLFKNNTLQHEKTYNPN